MEGARAFVQHSMTAPSGDSEGIPVAILEAGASGLPVIATRHAGIPEAVVDGETGYLVGEGDVNAMASRMRQLALEPELAGRLGARARAHVREHFRLSDTLVQLWGVLQLAMSGDAADDEIAERDKCASSGTGMIARSLGLHATHPQRVVAFASGVSDSACTSDLEFNTRVPPSGRHHRRRPAPDPRRSSTSREQVLCTGAGTAPPSRPNGPQPTSPYGRHQLACEEVVAASRIPYLIVRLPNVVGSPGNPKQLVPNLVGQVLAGRVHVQGRATRDLVDAGDMARTVARTS